MRIHDVTHFVIIEDNVGGIVEMICRDSLAVLTIVLSSESLLQPSPWFQRTTWYWRRDILLHKSHKFFERFGTSHVQFHV
jgi:hypothetical protein